MAEQEQAEWIRLERVAEQKPIEVKPITPLPGQRDFLANEPGPREEFVLSGNLKPKRRRRRK